MNAIQRKVIPTITRTSSEAFFTSSARRNYFKCRNEVVIMYSNEENFKRSNVRVFVDEENFCKEGLKHIFGRMIRDFAMSAVAAEEENKGEEK